MSFAAAAMLLSACSSDEPITPGNSVEDGYVNFIKVNIATPNGTRANEGTGYDDGTDDEHAVSNLIIAYYNANGDYVGQQRIENPKFSLEGTTTDNVTSVYSTTVLTNLKDGSNGSVMCYINVSDDFTVPASLTTLNTNKVDLDEAKNTTGFEMCNSVWYESESSTTPHVAAPIGKVFTSEAEANAATGTDVTEVFVEREVAKVTVAMNTTDFVEAKGKYTNEQADYVKSADASASASSLKFVVDKWFLSATANESYLVKGFYNNDAAVATYANINSLFSNKYAVDPNWNRISDSRTFWATPLNFYQATYPADYTEARPANSTVLNYKSWNDNGNVMGGFEYCLEHAALSPETLTANTSVAVVGHYELDGETASFYLYGFATKDNKTVPALYKDVNKLWESIIVDLGLKKVGEDGNAARASVEEAQAVLELVAHATKGSEEVVALKDGANLEGYKLGANDLNEENLASAAGQLASIRFYNLGKAFYWIPIEHFGKGSVNEKAAVVTGTYGVIRNHSYKIDITGVAGLAIPVVNPDEPLIPTTPEEANYIRAKINILAWRVWNTQSAVLGQ